MEELLQEGDDVIISTGGGVVVTERNRQLLAKNRKHNVWLHASFDVVYDRIEKDIKNKRLPASPAKQSNYLITSTST